MRDVKNIVEGVLNNSIEIKDLTVDELDATVDGLVDIAENLLDTENHEVGVAMLGVLREAIELRVDEMNSGFKEAILDAESRGSTYWEFENTNIH